jgi:hypothetical protein
VPWKRVVVRGRKRDELSHILRKEWQDLLTDWGDDVEEIRWNKTSLWSLAWLFKVDVGSIIQIVEDRQFWGVGKAPDKSTFRYAVDIEAQL